MKKTLKIIAILFGALVVLIAAAVIIAPMVINPNDYKDDIAKAVRERTGRELRIPGKIELSVFPWLGVKLGEVELSNAKGFGPKPFARVASADVRVKLLPLLRKHIELSTVSLHGLRLNLSRNAQGQTNWADLTAGKSAAATAAGKTAKPAKGGAAPLAALAVGGLDVQDAALVWDDRLHKQHLSIDHLQLESGALAPGKPFPLKLALDVDNSAPALKGHIALAGRMRLDPARESYLANDFSVSADLTGAAVPGRHAAARVSAKKLDVNLKRQTLQTQDLKIDGPGMTVTGHAAGTHLLGKPELVGELNARVSDGEALLKAAGGASAVANPAALDGATLKLPFRVSLASKSATVKPLRLQWQDLTLNANVDANNITGAPALSGTLSTNTFSPRKLAEAIKVALPATAAHNVFAKASLNGHFSASSSAAAIKDLKLDLDDSKLTGEASVRDFAKPVVRFSLTLNGIDADRYLPPPAKDDKSRPTAATPGQAAAGAAAQLPLKTLRNLDLEGSLHVGRLKIAKLSAADIRINARAKKGRLALSPLSAKMYRGSYAGSLGLDVSGSTPRLSADETLSRVQIGPLLKDLSGKEHVIGTANIKAKIHAAGLDAKRIQKTLNGQASFSVDNATLKDVNIPHEMCKAYSLIKHLPPPPAADNKTDFTNISGSATITNGVAHNKDLKAESALLGVKGQGTANLVTQRLDYDTDVTLVKSLKCTAQAELTDLKFVEIPMHISGSFTSPSFKLDVQRALRAAVKHKVEEKKQEIKQKAKEKLKKDLENGLKKLFQR